MKLFSLPFIDSLLRALFLASIAGSAVASDYYVDAVHGNDSNTGATPRQAWKTITHAINADTAQTIHVAPGVYDAALGEAFPFRLQEHPDIQIVGTEGSAVTILDGGGSGDLLTCFRYHHYGWSGPLTRVEGFTLRNAQRGLILGSAELEVQLTCRGLVFTGMSDWALSISASTSFAAGSVNGTFEHVRIANCRGALYSTTSTATSAPAHLTLSFTDTTIENNRSEALRILDSQACGTTIVLDRVRMTNNALGGITISQTGGLSSGGLTSTTLRDCLVANNGGVGLHASYDGGTPPTIPAGSIATFIERCTIANNAGTGLDLFFTLINPSATQTTLENTIVYGNQDDVRENPAQPSIGNPHHCDIGDGDFAGSDGNIALDPRFRGAGQGDYRLVWNSPCVDAGGPLAITGARDVAGVARPVDGNLDAVEVADIGCHEFTTLDVVNTVHVGGTCTLEQWGPSGGTSILFVARGQPLATPIVTPFGEFDLGAARNLGAMGVGARPPASRVLQVPSSASYAGLTLTFQALATSSVLAPSQAYTNPLTFTIVP